MSEKLNTQYERLCTTEDGQSLRLFFHQPALEFGMCDETVARQQMLD